MSTTETLPFLGRCHCGYAVRADASEASPQVERLRQVETPGVPYRMGAQYYVRCPEGHKPFKLYRVDFTQAEEGFVCDARCENAKGHVCKCSCGGMNHGLAWAVTPEQIEVQRSTAAENIGRAVAEMNERYGVKGIQAGGQSISNDELRGERPRRPEKVFAEGEEGDERGFVGKLIAKKDTANSTLYTFVVKVGDDEAIVKSFVPSFAIPDPEPEVRDIVEFEAIIKEHQDHPDFGKSTLVSYLKVLEINP